MSSDDDIDFTNIPLSDRIRSKDASSHGLWSKPSSSKSLKGSKKKNPRQASKRYPASSSSPLSTDKWIVPETPSPYCLGSKKRQNRDKNEPVSARPKRTCLASSFLQPDWRNFKKKNGVVENPAGGLDSDIKRSFLPKITGSTSSSSSNGLDQNHLLPEETYEKCSENSNPLSETDGPSSSIASSSSASNDKAGLQGHRTSLNHCSHPLSIPSTSRCHQSSIIDDDDDSQKSLLSRAVSFMKKDDDDSDSEESKYFNGVSLKTGRYFPDYIHRVRKIIGKGARKILDSEDSSEDECEWQSQYRRPNNCPSPDSDDSSDVPIIPQKKHFTKHSLAQLSSSDSNEDSVGSVPVHTQSASKDLNMPSSSKSKCSAIKSTKQMSSELNGNPSANSAHPIPSQSGQTSSDSPFLALRNRWFTRSNNSRRSISPHPRILNSHRHSGLPRSFGQREYRRHHHLASEFPDIFDAEDSSEVEFFTAPSYSDTETSTESATAVNVNSSLCGSATGHQNSPADARNNSTIVLNGSSDDEVKIIFSGNSSTMPDRTTRRGRNRGSGLRRHRPQGSGRTPSHSLSQDASGSPDPVAQVRQVEEDEQFARMLQAEFDAEVNEMATYVSDSDSDESAIIDPVGLDPVPPQFPPLPCRPFITHPPPIILRGMSRIGIHSTLSGGRRRRGRRNATTHQGDPWMYQFARVLGLGPTHHHHHHHHHHHEENDSDYEALIHLAETVGEAIPRGLHKAEINRLPTRKFFLPGSASTSHDCEEIVHKRTDLNKECQVCLSDYENGDILRILPCFHEFHTPCIDPWLKINHTCPVCRVEVSFNA